LDKKDGKLMEKEGKKEICKYFLHYIVALYDKTQDLLSLADAPPVTGSSFSG